MALFRRRRPATSDPTVAITEFWSQWDDLRGVLAAALDNEEPVPQEASQRLTDRVRRIHPALEWETAPAGAADFTDLGRLDAGPLSDSALEDLAKLDGLDEAEDLNQLEQRSEARYTLTLTGGDDDTARILAERWRQAAAEDTDWRFFPARQTDHEKLNRPASWHGHELDLGHVSVALRVNQKLAKIEASVYHPDNMFLSEETQAAVASYVVLLALGEDDVVRWIGKVEPLTEKPLDPLPPTSMPSVVQQLAGALGVGGWVSLQGRIPMRGPLQMVVRHPLHRRDFPACTLYVPVSVHYAHADADKLPTGSSETALEEFTTGLRELLGEDGALLAHQTFGGQRHLHFYLDPESEALSRLESAVHAWSEGKSHLNSYLDPDWDAIGQITKPVRKQLGG